MSSFVFSPSLQPPSAVWSLRSSAARSLHPSLGYLPPFKSTSGGMTPATALSHCAGAVSAFVSPCDAVAAVTAVRDALLGASASPPPVVASSFAVEAAAPISAESAALAAEVEVVEDALSRSWRAELARAVDAAAVAVVGTRGRGMAERERAGRSEVVAPAGAWTEAVVAGKRGGGGGGRRKGAWAAGVGAGRAAGGVDAPLEGVDVGIDSLPEGERMKAEPDSWYESSLFGALPSPSPRELLSLMPTLLLIYNIAGVQTAQAYAHSIFVFSTRVVQTAARPVLLWWRWLCYHHPRRHCHYRR